MSTLIKEEEYLEAVNNYIGWCEHCKEFTRDGTEPDAQNYDCPQCENDSVVGAEDALMMDLIRF